MYIEGILKVYFKICTCSVKWYIEGLLKLETRAKVYFIALCIKYGRSKHYSHFVVATSFKTYPRVEVDKCTQWYGRKKAYSQIFSWSYK